MLGGNSIAIGDNDVVFYFLQNTNTTQNKSFNLQLSNPNDTDYFLLGGVKIPTGVAKGFQTLAPVTILSYVTSPGTLSFSSATYKIAEPIAGTTNAIITVIRTNGTAGIVTIQYSTFNGTATNGTDYVSTSGRLTFSPGQTSASFPITIKNHNRIEHDHTVLLQLFNPTGGASAGTD